jgi:hypothetical protein
MMVKNEGVPGSKMQNKRNCTNSASASAVKCLYVRKFALFL